LHPLKILSLQILQRLISAPYKLWFANRKGQYYTR
jgi:hypothetical protein